MPKTREHNDAHRAITRTRGAESATARPTARAREVTAAIDAYERRAPDCVARSVARRAINDDELRATWTDGIWGYGPEFRSGVVRSGASRANGTSCAKGADAERRDPRNVVEPRDDAALTICRPGIRLAEV